jgi:murein DD-endopeptidase MepM/ murein hydrolase activator NlpD
MQIAFDPGDPAPLLTAGPLTERLRRQRDRLSQRLGSIAWAFDLAEDIGSARWFRGLGTMLGLSLFALSFWPDYSSLEAAPGMKLSPAQRDEFRSQMILPLALGADSGRHMGPTTRISPLANAPERPMVQLVATLGQGDSFGRMLQRAGVAPGDAARLSELVAGSVPLGEIAPGTRFDLTLGSRAAPDRPRPLDTLDFRARFDLNLSAKRRGGNLVLVRQPIAIDSTPLRIRGVVGNSLYRSARAAGAPIGAIQQYLQAIDAHLSIDSDILPEDTFDIIVSYKRSASGETQLGDLLFAGLERSGKPQAQLLRWGGANNSGDQFFEASGMGQRRTGLIMPVVGHITSNYGARRHPILGYTRMHAGVDFGAAYGSPIFAVGDATVSFAGWHGGHGNYVKLEHGGGYGTGYGHMSRIAVYPGARIRAGQIIGYVGSTGLSTGPHLHYELYQNGHTVDPMSVRFTVSNAVDPKELAAFKAKLAALKGVKPGAALISLAPRQAEISAPGREIARLAD